MPIIEEQAIIYKPRAPRIFLRTKRSYYRATQPIYVPEKHVVEMIPPDYVDLSSVKKIAIENNINLALKLDSVKKWTGHINYRGRSEYRKYPRVKLSLSEYHENPIMNIINRIFSTKTYKSTADYNFGISTIENFLKRISR